MTSPLWPAVERGRHYAFPAVWAAVFAAGVGLYQPLPTFQATSLLAFDADGPRPTMVGQLRLPPMTAGAASLTFVRHDLAEPDDLVQANARDGSGAHGRFGALGNAVRRQVQLRPINPRTADELAGVFRDVSYTLTDVRQGEAVPPIKLQRVPDDLGSKDGLERKLLFITALLPVILEVNHRVAGDREQLLVLREKFVKGSLSVNERLWLERLAERYETSADKLDELVRRVDIVPPSMAIAQGGVESGWGTSFAARAGNSLFGQIQSTGRHSVSVPWKPGAGMPQPFSDVGEGAEAYVVNLNTHPAYAAFRAERAAMRTRGEELNGYHLIGQLLRYSEMGQDYVRFVRQIMREDRLTDFDKARLSSF